MDEVITVAVILKNKFIKPIFNAKFIWSQTVPDIKADEKDYERILAALNEGLIKFTEKEEINIENKTETGKNNSTLQNNKSARVSKRSMKHVDNSITPQRTRTRSGIGSYSSVSPDLSKIISAQVADHILDEVHNIVKSRKHKPTDFNDQQCEINLHTPPAKSRRTSKKQSAVSTQENQKISCMKLNIAELNGEHSRKPNLTTHCTPRLKNLVTQQYDFIRKNRNTPKRNSEVCSRSLHLKTNGNNTNRYEKVDFIKSKSISGNLYPMTTADINQNDEYRNKKKSDYLLSPTGKEIPKQELEYMQVSDKQVSEKYSIGKFSHSSVSHEKSNLNKENNLLKLDNKSVEQKDKYGIENEKIRKVSEKEIVVNNKINSNGNTSKTTTKNSGIHNNHTVESNEFPTENIRKSHNDSWSIRSRTKVIKKGVVNSKAPINLVETENKFDKDEIKLENEIKKVSEQSRTINIQNNNSHEITEYKENIDFNGNSNYALYKTGVKKRGTQKYDETPLHHQLSAGKGNLTKKNTVHIKKMNCEVDQLPEKRITRATRNKENNKILLLPGIQNIKESQNVPRIKMTPDNTHRTPLATYNKVTSDINTVLKTQAGIKGIKHRQYRIESTSSKIVVKAQLVEDIDKKTREEKRLKRKAQEDSAKKKKEEALRATAEEVRRKREVKLQKVAAARQAAEIEKIVLEKKSQKEREDKCKKIPARRGQKLKKRLIMHTKLSEEAEIRKEEAVCLVMLKKLDDEHNKLIAKEMEQEMALKDQVSENARLEKTTNQTITELKLSGVKKINAEPKNTHIIKPKVQSYDVTPARNERQLLKPKTENDYGVEDALTDDSSDDESNPKKMLPSWAQSQNRDHLLHVNKLLPDRIWGLFMQAGPPPSIMKIFACNPIRKRTSSAIWNTPPNYSHFKRK